MQAAYVHHSIWPLIVIAICAVTLLLVTATRRRWEAPLERVMARSRKDHDLNYEFDKDW